MLRKSIFPTARRINRGFGELITKSAVNASYVGGILPSVPGKRRPGSAAASARIHVKQAGARPCPRCISATLSAAQAPAATGRGASARFGRVVEVAGAHLAGGAGAG